MKEMSKARVLTKKSVPSVMNEIRILSTLQHRYHHYLSSTPFLTIAQLSSERGICFLRS